MDIKITISCDRIYIPFASKTIRHLCALADVSGHPALKNAELALVELLTNIIDHSGGRQASKIEINYVVDHEQFTIDVVDNGLALSPEQALAYTDDNVSMPALESNIDLLPESGWGVQLIKSACDQVFYQRSEKCNKYRLAFNLSTVECES